MFAKGDRVRIVKIVITHEDQLVSMARTVACLGKVGTISYIGHLYCKETEFPYYVTMDSDELDHCYWREEELERV